VRLARKIVLAVGLLAILVIAGLETFGVVRELRTFAADMEHDHRVLGETLGAAVGRAWALGGRGEALDLVAVANRSQHELSVRWVWLSGLGDEGPSVRFDQGGRAELLQSGWLSRRIQSPSPGRLVSWTPVRIGDRLGALEITQSLAGERKLLLHSALAALAALALLGALFFAAAVFLG